MPTTDIKLQDNWKEINAQIVGVLGTIVDPSLQRELVTITTAADAWRKLKEKTQSKGIIAKLENMQAAIRARFTPGIPFNTTITNIQDWLGEIFDPDPSKQEEWLIILLLNALSDGEFDWLRKDLLLFHDELKSPVDGPGCYRAN
ncbi:hypothetical protein K439DRAFT_1623161 [Ramaria rubella]|nr:hypothetical protein K439DRAFT_1623161 [Ramaria rubella]